MFKVPYHVSQYTVVKVILCCGTESDEVHIYAMYNSNEAITVLMSV
jgi:hypothetical protein